MTFRCHYTKDKYVFVKKKFHDCVELEVAIKEWLRRSSDRIRGTIMHKKNNTS